MEIDKIQKRFDNIGNELGGIDAELAGHPLSEYFSQLSGCLRESIRKYNEAVSEGHDFKPDGKMVAYLWKDSEADGFGIIPEEKHMVLETIDDNKINSSYFIGDHNIEDVRMILMSKGYEVIKSKPPEDILSQ